MADYFVVTLAADIGEFVPLIVFAVIIISSVVKGIKQAVDSGKIPGRGQTQQPTNRPGQQQPTTSAKQRLEDLARQRRQQMEEIARRGRTEQPHVPRAQPTQAPRQTPPPVTPSVSRQQHELAEQRRQIALARQREDQRRAAIERRRIEAEHQKQTQQLAQQQVPRQTIRDRVGPTGDAISKRVQKMEARREKVGSSFFDEQEKSEQDQARRMGIDPQSVGHEAKRIHRHVKNLKTTVKSKKTPSGKIQAMGRTPLQHAILLKELLDKPLAMRDTSSPHSFI